MKNVTLLLHNIRSVHNVGSIFRTAECLGISRIVLSGVSPTPLDRFGRKRKDLAKVALGAEDMVPWEVVTDSDEFVQDFKKKGGMVIVVEQDPRSVDYKKAAEMLEKGKGGKRGAPTLVVFGSEVRGAPRTHLDLADIIAEIPQSGLKESLNVAVAAGIVLFSWFDR